MACEHRGCKCDEEDVRKEGKQFCSDFCATAQLQNRHEKECRCGHAECRQP